MNQINFTFSDTIAGYVTGFDQDADSFGLRTTDDREYAVKFAPGTYAWIANNLEEPRQWVGGQMRDMLQAGPLPVRLRRLLPRGRRQHLRGAVHHLRRPHGRQLGLRAPGLVGQADRVLGDFYLKAQFGDQPVDYQNYRTTITLTGDKAQDNYRQETDTISRLVYGFASCYLLTGEDRFLEGAEKGTEYLREHMRFFDPDENVVYWYHGIDVSGTPRDQGLRLGVRRRLRRHPGLRADLRPGRPDPDLPHHRRPAHPARRRDDRGSVRPLLPGPARRRLLLAPRPDHPGPAERRRWARTRARRTGTRWATTRRPT